MKLLICTQKVDKNDDVLGFFHNWIKKFSEKAEKITVICLEKGVVELPKNVTVFSLGKESLKIENSNIENSLKIENFKLKIFSRIKYILRFYKFIWQNRHNYDVVFVHMNKEYVVLGWKIWFLLGKRIVFWHNHKVGTFMTKLAGLFSHKILYTSPDSFFAGNRKAKIMPVGIDTDLFRKNPNILPKFNSFLCLGRISPVKKLEVVIEAAKILAERKADFTVSIVGGAPAQDKNYFEKIKKDSVILQENGLVKFFPSVPNDKAPEIYQTNLCLVNTTIPGSMDKTIFEAMASEMSVLSSNIGLRKIWPEDLCAELLFKENDSGDLAQKMEKFSTIPQSEREEIGKKLREIVLEKHSLSVLTKKLFHVFNS